MEKKKKVTPEELVQSNKVHKADVKKALSVVKSILNYKGNHHDLDKDSLVNAEILAKGLNEGDWNDWTNSHMLKQRHHVECFLNLKDRDLFDLIEMVCDGLVAHLRRNSSEKISFDSEKDFYINKGFDDNLATILANSIIKIHNLLELDDEEDILDEE